MRRHHQRRQDPKKPLPSAPHFNSLTRDYGLASTELRHRPSSGFGYSEAESYRDERSVNANVRYIPDENNRDEFREWQDYEGRNFNPEIRKRFASRTSPDFPRNDDEIFDLVYEVLSKHPDVDVSQVDLDVRDGVAVLHGHVETRRMKRLIEDVIYGLPGVHDIQNRIEVERPDPDRRRIAHSLA